MIRYSCPCSNVTIEAPKVVDDATDNQQNLERTQSFLDTNENTPEVKEACANFLSSESYLQTKIFNSKNELDSFDSHLNAKYPLLIGTMSKNYQEHSTLLKVNKCLICDVMTHIEFIQESKITETEHSDTAKKSVLENRHFSDKTTSHSAPVSRNLNTSTKYCMSILVNIELMILNYDNEKLTNSDNYSSVYDILLDDKKETTVNSSKSFDDLKMKINEVPIFEQRRFLNQINEKYTLSHTTSSKEEVFKQKFETLVNCLLNNESTSTANVNSSSRQNQAKTQDIQPANRAQLSNSEKRKGHRKNDENLLSSSVFGMEEIDESEDDSKFLSDRDSQDEDEDANQPDYSQKSILKKRNSNIRDSDTGSAIVATRNIISKNNKTQIPNQYSCSLPRDIPVMTVRQSMARTYHKDYDGTNNENFFNPAARDHHQQHNKTQMVTNSYKQPSAFQNYQFSTSNDDDDIFEDESAVNQQENLDIDEDDTSNMGHAISTLASSIVIKDGRELFGGVPSRRVPINSISKSCYE